MKVLLIYPVSPRSHWPKGRFRSRWVPTGLAYIAAAMRRAGHEVRVHVREEHLMKLKFDWKAASAHLRTALAEFRPEMVGLSICSSMVAEAGVIARWAKEICGQDVLVVGGGPHPTAIPEATLTECPAIDVIVVGEGERTLVELAERGAKGDVAGLVYRQDGAFVRSPSRPQVHDLDSLGPPAYDLFDMDFYTTPDRWMIRWLKLAATNIRTSRGCPNRCRFCAGHIVAGLGVRYHSLDYVLEQILQAVNRFGVEAIRFEDDTVGTDPARLLDLCEALRRHDLHRRIRWECCLRVDQADTELLRRMKQAGCIQVEYGFESGSDEALKRLGKNTGVELNRRAVRLTREVGLRIFADIMIGLPGETEAELRATMDFLRWARPEIITAGRLHPLPGTPIFNELPEEVRQSINWADYTYIDGKGLGVNLTAMPDERFEELYRRFFKYFVRPQIKWALFRDAPRDDLTERRLWGSRVARFVMHHPIHAIRVPWS